MMRLFVYRGGPRLDGKPVWPAFRGSGKPFSALRGFPGLTWAGPAPPCLPRQVQKSTSKGDPEALRSIRKQGRKHCINPVLEAG